MKRGSSIVVFLFILALFIFNSGIIQAKTTTYIYAGNLVASKSSDEQKTQYYIQDHLGSNVKVVDTGIEQQNKYYAFGETNSIGASENDYKYTGKELDSETGLYYYGARYYDPELGRFVQADVVTGSLQDPLSLNRYAYVKNNPLKFVDPSGNAEKTASFSYGATASSQFNKGYGITYGITGDVSDFGFGKKTKAKLNFDFSTGGKNIMAEAIHPVFGTWSGSLSGEITENVNWEIEHTSTNSVAEGVENELVGPYSSGYLGQENQLTSTHEGENIENSIGVAQIDSYGSVPSLLNLDTSPILFPTEDKTSREGLLLRNKVTFEGGGAISMAMIIDPNNDDVIAMGFSTSPIKTTKSGSKYSVSGTFISSGNDVNYGVSLNLNF